MTSTSTSPTTRRSGTMSMDGQAKPRDGRPRRTAVRRRRRRLDVIATLPLAEGYTTTFRNFDVQKQKPTLKQLKVVGTEEVTVPAGTFKAFKVRCQLGRRRARRPDGLDRARHAEGRQDHGDRCRRWAAPS